jgi:hypothetical protein
MEKSAFLPLPERMLIDQVHQTDSQLSVIVISTIIFRVCHNSYRCIRAWMEKDCKYKFQNLPHMLPGKYIYV